MKRFNEVAPVVENGDLVIRIPERPDNRANGINVSNEASPVRLAVWAFLMLALAAAIITYAIHTLTGLSLEATAIIGIVVFLATGYRALIILNGDYPATYNIHNVEKTERQRIKSSERVFATYYGLKAQEEGHRHVERMAEIEQGSAITRLQSDMAGVQDMIGRLLTNRDDVQPLAKAGVYVPAAPRPALIAAQEWTFNLYDKDTRYPKPELVHDNGALRMSVPWRRKGGEWVRNDWGTEAAGFVLNEIQQYPPLVLPIVADGKPRGYRLNVEEYPTLGDAQRVFVRIA